MSLSMACVSGDIEIDSPLCDFIAALVCILRFETIERCMEDVVEPHLDAFEPCARDKRTETEPKSKRAIPSIVKSKSP